MAYSVTLDTLIEGYPVAQRGMEALCFFYIYNAKEKVFFLPSISSRH